MKILQTSCTHLCFTEFNQVCTKSLLTLNSDCILWHRALLVAGKTQVRGKSQAHTVIESSLESTLSIPHALSFTPHIELCETYEIGTLSPILYMGHRNHFPKVWELLSGGTWPGTWVFLSLCPPSLDWTTAQVIQMLEIITPDETNAGEESKTQHYLVGLLMMMIQNFNPNKLGLSLHFDRRKKFQVTDLILLFNLLMFKWCPPTMGVGRRTWDQLFPWPLSALYLLFHRLVFSFWFSFCPPSSKKRIKSHTLELI